MSGCDGLCQPILGLPCPTRVPAVSRGSSARWDVPWPVMSNDAETVLREALDLPLDERAQIAAELAASLEEDPADDPEVVRLAWAAELSRRAAQALADDGRGEPWPAVRERVRNKLTG